MHVLHERPLVRTLFSCRHSSNREMRSLLFLEPLNPTSLPQYGNGFAMKDRPVFQMLTYLAPIFLDLAIICTIIPHNYPEPRTQNPEPKTQNPKPNALALNFELWALIFHPSPMSYGPSTISHEPSTMNCIAHPLKYILPTSWQQPFRPARSEILVEKSSVSRFKQ